MKLTKYQILRKSDNEPVRVWDFDNLDGVEDYFASPYFVEGMLVGTWKGRDDFTVVVHEIEQTELPTPEFKPRACMYCGEKCKTFDELVAHRQKDTAHDKFVRL